MDGNSIREGIICKEALRIYANQPKKTPSTSAEGESWLTFKASRGWFEKYKHRRRIHNIAKHGEAASSNKEAVKKYVGEFINAGGFLPQQVINCDETGLFS